MSGLCFLGKLTSRVEEIILNMNICKLCYREFEDKDMARNASGELSTQCATCTGIIGKGSGYAANISDEEAEKWFEGNPERKAKLKEEGKI